MRVLTLPVLASSFLLACSTPKPPATTRTTPPTVKSLTTSVSYTAGNGYLDFGTLPAGAMPTDPVQPDTSMIGERFRVPAGYDTITAFNFSTSDLSGPGFTYSIVHDCAASAQQDPAPLYTGTSTSPAVAIPVIAGNYYCAVAGVPDVTQDAG